jgi:hypothetical protein
MHKKPYEERAGRPRETVGNAHKRKAARAGERGERGERCVNDASSNLLLTRAGLDPIPSVVDLHGSCSRLQAQLRVRGGKEEE